jgi:hypothetical protein
MDLEKPDDVLVMISSALEHHTDGKVYDGNCIGYLSWDGDDLLVPIVTMEQAAEGNYSVRDNPVTVYRVKIESVIP